MCLLFHVVQRAQILVLRGLDGLFKCGLPFTNVPPFTVCCNSFSVHTHTHTLVIPLTLVHFTHLTFNKSIYIISPSANI